MFNVIKITEQSYVNCVTYKCYHYKHKFVHVRI